MKKVSIRYNPYKLETEITVDGNKLAQNSKLGEKADSGVRLQEWIEELPKNLIDEYNDTDFKVTFHGTVLDYEDLAAAFAESEERDELNVELKRIPATETEDKEALIDKVFKEIQEGPFEELRDIEIINAFQHAKSSNFEVCVVATMSAGKSTLINAMLGTKLMPSKQEACTAIITRIKDDTEVEEPWQAEVYDREGKLLETHKSLTYPTMERLNGDENISEIKVTGDIPFVTSEDVSLVLIDTPGPNNSRDPEHKKVQSEFLGKSSKSLVLYIMTGEFGTDDDNALLKRVSDSMAVGGKQSKDRFIFVINKLDDRKKEDGDTAYTLERVRSYLKTHGINNPNIFPAAALPALNLRLLDSGAEVDEDTMDETDMKVRKLNRNETLHFEKYASLPSRIKGEIIQQVFEAKENNNARYEALLHTGIPSVEAAVRQYVQKYAKTAKIKNIVDTFMHKLDEVGFFEETKREIVKHQNDSKRILNQIDLIRKKVDDIELAKNFQNTVDEVVKKVNDDALKAVEDIVQKFQSRISNKINNLPNEELDINDAKDEMEILENFARKLEPEFEVELDELIRESLIKSGTALLEEYSNKLAGLTDELDVSDLKGINIDPLRLMGDRFVTSDFSINSIIKEKKVEDGEEWVENPDKYWFKPWTWFKEKGYFREKYKTVEYINGSELAYEFLNPIQVIMHTNAKDAREYALKQSERIANHFNDEFKRLDNVLKQKLAELESFATDHEKVEVRLCESELKLKWLEQIKKNVESILKI